ncbi:hypothetical protein D3C85_1871420 [compost metagenome]
MINWSEEAAVPSDCWIEGSATLTMKKSSGGKNAPTNKMANISQRRGSGRATFF